MSQDMAQLPLPYPLPALLWVPSSLADYHPSSQHAEPTFLLTFPYL